MKFNFRDTDGLKAFQLFLDDILFKLTAQGSTKEQLLIAAILRELYAVKVMPRLVRDEPQKFKIILSKIELITLDVVLSQYDFTEIGNSHTALILNSLYMDIDQYLVNNTKHYPSSCETPLISNTGASNTFISG